jgi:hypothetical protein
MVSDAGSRYAEVKGPYNQRSVRERILALFMDNIGRIVAREQIQLVAGEGIENWHQRLSELRTDYGYTILTNRDRRDLRPGQYLMTSTDRRAIASRRVLPAPEVWLQVLISADHRCEWREDAEYCGLADGDIDPVGGGHVKLTPDHKTPHSMDPASDPYDPSHWQALCGRHQVTKKNFWDSSTGKFNYTAIIQAAPASAKRDVYELLREFFGDQ